MDGDVGGALSRTLNSFVNDVSLERSNADFRGAKDTIARSFFDFPVLTGFET